MQDQSTRPRVMFVDDDPMLLASTRRQLMLKIDHCELQFCSSGAEALSKAAETPPDIIFSDVRMPEMDGPELLSRIAELYPRTIRYAWTGQTEPSQQHHVDEVADRVFTKPCNTETLCEIIQTAISLIGNA